MWKILKNKKRIINRIQISNLGKLSFLLPALLILQACSINKFVIRQTGTLLDYSVQSLYEETDLILAEQALASDIKLLEGMLKGDPGNEHLLLLTCQALSGYALGFAEDEMPERAKSLYLRARDYGLELLRKDKEFFVNENKSIEEFKNAIDGFQRNDIDKLFWTAFSWAGWINLSLDNPRAFLDLVKVQEMMQKVLDLDETHFHGAAHLFFGSYWGTMPKMLGGNPEKAKEHFEKNIEITAGKFLLTYVYYVQYYATKTLNDSLFDELIQKIDTTSVDVLPGYQLLNSIAKKKAQRLHTMRDDFF